MSAAEEIRRLEVLADWLDSKFRIPGTGIRFGLDGVLGLIPGVGDLITFAPALWLVLRARHLGVPWHVQARMLWNTVLDLAIGSIPLLGDLFDIGFKANRRNVALLKRHFERRGVPV